MSVLGKKWLIKNPDPEKEIFKKLLENRNLQTIEELADFHDPFLFKDMNLAVSRIKKAIDSSERIIVFGDYDVDGVTAAAIVIHTLKVLKANYSYRLPHRVEDGYGLSEKFIDEFAEKNVGLIITVDCGISCSAAVSKAKSLNIDTIITDHHTVSDAYPKDAFAILHPKMPDSSYPFADLTGAGVALKLAHALAKKFLPQESQFDHLNSLLDLATLGTIADLGPLIGENRFIVRQGLQNLAHTRWPGLRKIKELAYIKEGENIDPMKVGFQITPRLNAAGRLSTAYSALQLLLEEDEEKILYLSKHLEQLNQKRQLMTEKAMNEAEKYFLDQQLPQILIAHSPDWHVGILGLIASKLVEKFNRPAIVMQDLNDNLVASARSPQFFNIVEAIENSKQHLISYGGHAQAAGFSIEESKLETFCSEINIFAEAKLKNLNFEQILEIDCELSGEQLSFNLFDEIQRFAPFGIGNQKPNFILKNVKPQLVNLVGETKNHLKFNFNTQVSTLNVIAFKMGQYFDQIKSASSVDIVFQLDRNIWNQKHYLNLHALDFKINQ